jgi:hypothetical protein
LRDAGHRRPLNRFFGLVMGIPQALLGLTCVAFGLAMIAWVLYNSFIERQPEYSGGFLTFGIGPLSLMLGVGWLLDAFRVSKIRSSNDEAGRSRTDERP